MTIEIQKDYTDKEADKEIKKFHERQRQMDLIEEKHEQIHKRINNIHSFMVHENELCLGGTDEHGEDLTIWFDCYDFLEWIDTENLEYIKERLSKYIKEK